MSEKGPIQDSLSRYARQTILKEVGIEGQARLASSSVLVVGAGGLGSAALYYLAAAGVGRLGIVDYDQVSLSNLQRQILYTSADLGNNKVDIAALRLQALNPAVRTDKHQVQINAGNAQSIISGYDLVVDAVDNLPTRYIVNDACCALGKPLVEAAVSGFDGLLMTIIPGKTPCYRCLFPSPLPDEYASQVGNGIMGMVPGVIGSLEALEAIKVLLNIGSPLSGRFLSFRGLDMHFEEIILPRDPNCPACSGL
ncbi:MAG TPA: HesA/MoeB/ThiF family protein [Syntrophomonadaceae bacterium]|nr:HesA/MoeB/ThiF family protein [Syntrophomonadaceae bacterium]HPU49620.1 HesA/MoeB/ThiF family protein [Syntrophomonadaceae bacterium]